MEPLGPCVPAALVCSGPQLREGVNEQVETRDASVLTCVQSTPPCEVPGVTEQNAATGMVQDAGVDSADFLDATLSMDSVFLLDDEAAKRETPVVTPHRGQDSSPDTGEQDISGKILVDRVYGHVGLDERMAARANGFLHASPEAEERDDWLACVDEMIEGIVAAEHYCVDYSSKEQPHAQGLLHTLHDSMVRAERFDQEKLPAASAEEPTHFDSARRLLQRLVAATNRRLHKGFPSIYAYLLGRPNHYCSHEFVKYSFA